MGVPGWTEVISLFCLRFHLFFWYLNDLVVRPTRRRLRKLSNSNESGRRFFRVSGLPLDMLTPPRHQCRLVEILPSIMAFGCHTIGKKFRQVFGLLHATLALPCATSATNENLFYCMLQSLNANSKEDILRLIGLLWVSNITTNKKTIKDRFGSFPSAVIWIIIITTQENSWENEFRFWL